jgi:hypothetical protein
MKPKLIAQRLSWEKSSLRNWATSVHNCKKRKENNRPMGDNSPNPATLILTYLKKQAFDLG